MIHEALKAFRVMTVAVMFYLAVRSCMHTFEIIIVGEHEDDVRKPLGEQEGEEALNTPLGDIVL